MLLSFFVLLAAVMTWLVLAKPLRLDTDFRSLLPDDLPCVKESKRVSSLVGSTDYLYVAIESDFPEDNISFADDIVILLEKHPDIDWVSSKEDKSFFRDSRLLYLDTPDLEEIQKRAQARLDFEKKVANPFYINLNNEEPPDIGFDDIMAKYDERLDKFGVKGLLTSKSSKKDLAAGVGTDYISNEDGTLVTVMARPFFPATDLTSGRKLVEDVTAFIEQVNPGRNETMRVEVAGSYRNRYIEYNNIVGDIFSSLGMSVLLIILFVAFFFRRLRALALIFLPLVGGIIITVALTAIILGRLNMVTALIFAVLLGLGIDFGVHLTSRYLDERSRGKSLQESLNLSLQKTGRAILTAGITTALGLGVLVLADFKGFSEFGIIATMGIFVCLFVYLLILPALACALEKIGTPKPWRKKPVCFSEKRVVAKGTGFFLAALIVLITIFSVWGLFSIEFEYNFRKLGSREKVSSDIKYGDTLSQSSSPVVAVMNSPSDARVLTRYLEEIIDSDETKDLLLKNALSIFSFIPDEQEKKKEILNDLNELIQEALGLRKLNEKTRTRLKELEMWSQASIITMDSLPEWVRGKFTQKDKTVGTMVYMFPGVNEFYVNDMEKFYERFGIIELEDIGSIRPVASGFILVEVIRAVKKDGLMMTLVAFMVVILVLLIDFRSVKKALIVFIPLIVGMLWAAGVMALFNIKLGLYNMLVLPVLLGIGIDASVHFYHSYKENGPGSLFYVTKTTGMAVLAAAITTGVGFAGMMIVSHNGLRSIGNLAVGGILIVLIGSILTLFTFLSLLERYNINKISKS